MKVFLMHKDQDLDLQRELPPNEQTLTQDLELNTLVNAMALGDDFIFDVARKTVLLGLNNSLDTMRYRQDILEDCLRNSSIVRDIYTIAVESAENRKKRFYGIFGHYPTSILHDAMELLQMFVGLLEKLKYIAEEHAGKFESAGFTRFFTMLGRELDDEYFDSIQNYLRELKFRDGVLISAVLGKGNESTDYILRKPQEKNQSWINRIFAEINDAITPSSYTFHVPHSDEYGGRALSELRDRGINLVANALAQSSDHILSFFTMLRTELAFYVGCLNLHGQLVQIGEPVSFPLPVSAGERKHSFSELYDICLALTVKQKIVGNDGNADNKDLVLITGANQGGKSIFLRSIGLAQLMMQCGMFVPAKSFSANMCVGLFTHYKREEDATMKSGKLDEELGRMSEIGDYITPNSLVLFNESFAATNEREGSEIARQIVNALLEKHIKVFFVTHLYEFAHGFYNRKMENVMFLRAERQADGSRTFKLIEGEPLLTSFGEDLYKSVFGCREDTHRKTP